MPVHKGMKCSIQVGSRTLDEYEESNNPTTPEVITRYVDIHEAEGKSFSIEFEALPDLDWDNPSFTHILAHIKIDGARPHMVSCSVSRANPTCTQSESSYNQKINGEELSFQQDLLFSVLNITEERGFSSNTLNDASDPRFQSLGRIEVKMLRGTRLEGFTPSNDGDSCSSISSIHKKVIKGKAISHSVQLTAPKQMPKRTLVTYNYNYLDTKNKPFIKFVFLYRTRAHLQSMGIVPRVSSEEEELDDGAKTRKELLAELKALRNKIGEGSSNSSQRRKRERSEDISGPSKPTKVFKRTARPAWGSDGGDGSDGGNGGDIGVVDLTGDD